MEFRETNQRSVASIADVARQSGVSKATVSKVLHPNRRYELSDDVRQRVTLAAADLGYRPNWRGRLLAGGKAFTIGLLYARTTPLPGDAYERTIASAAEAILPRDYHLMHIPLIGQQSQWKGLLESQRIDGCLVMEPMQAELAEFLLGSSLPSVLLNVDTELPLSQVQADDAGGIGLLVQHLLSLGHERIVFCDGGASESNHNMAMRVEGFSAAMHYAGKSAHAQIAGSISRVLQLCDASKSNRATAAIAGDLPLAIELLHHFWRAGISVPQSMSLAAFGDAYPAEKLTPPLTAVRVPAEQLGREAASLLLDLIEGKQSRLPRKIVVRDSLIVRESTAPPGK